jgi:hypothetical protein
MATQAKKATEQQVDPYALQDDELTKEGFAKLAGDVSTKTVENWLKAGTIEGEYLRRSVDGKPIRKTLIIKRSELSKVDKTVKTTAIVKPQEMAEQVNMFLATSLQEFASAIGDFKQLPALGDGGRPSRLEQLAGKMYIDVDQAAEFSGIAKSKLTAAFHAAEDAGTLQRFSGDHGRAVWRTADLEKIIEQIPPTPIVRRTPPTRKK